MIILRLLFSLIEIPGATLFTFTFPAIGEMLHPAAGENGPHLHFTAAGADKLMGPRYGSRILTDSGHGLTPWRLLQSK